MRKSAGISMITALCLACTFLGGCESEKAEKMSTAIVADTQTADKGSLEISSSYIGSVSRNESVNVTPLVSGTVSSVKVKVGSEVKKGDVLCKFDDTAAQLTVDSAKASLESAEAGKNSAKSQQELSSVQTDMNIDSLEVTLKGYQDSLKEAQSQLSKLKESQSSLESAMNTTKNAYANAKTRYKTAQNLYLNYKAFLSANPDCQTTAGLTAAMTEMTNAVGNTTAGNDLTGSDESGDAPANTPDTEPNYPSGQLTSKAKTATALMQSLTAAGLTVEYLNDLGIGTLKEDSEDAKQAYETAAASYSEAQNGLSTLKTSISTLETQIEAAKSSLDGAKKTKGVSGKVSEDAEAVYDAQIDAAKVGVESAEYQADLYTVTAPIDGVVESVNVTADEIFGNGMPAFTISSKQSVLVTFYVTEEVRDFLEDGQSVEVESNGKNYVGNISQISVATDPQKGLFKIEAQVYLDSGESIASGTSVSLSLVTAKEEEQIIIPYDSVYYEDNQAYVYRVEDGKAVREDVETGLYNEESIVILSGIEEGDKVITTWASGLKNGAKIEEPEEGK